MDRPGLIFIIMPIVILLALFTGIALPFIAASGRSHAGERLARADADARRRIRAARRKAPPPEPGADNATPAGYLYVPCARVRYHGYPAGTRRWVQEVPVVRKTAKWIYYTSGSWDRSAAVVSPGRINREEFETGTRRDCPLPGPAGRLFFATREAAEEHLYRGERERAGQAAREGPPIRELRRAMADAHPDRGGTAEQFIQARRQYQTGLRAARR